MKSGIESFNLIFKRSNLKFKRLNKLNDLKYKRYIIQLQGKSNKFLMNFNTKNHPLSIVENLMKINIHVPRNIFF